MELYLFPITKGRKAPPLVAWRDESSSDPAQWDRWAERFPDCNWGLDCGKSGICVVDVDPKNGGDKSYGQVKDRLGTDAVVQTPSGGVHLYFHGVVPSSVSKLAPGIDTRSAGGYVLFPGSVVEGKVYAGEIPETLPAAPQWVVDALGGQPENQRDARVLVSELDKPVNVAKAVLWLANSAPVPMEGERDHTCFRVGCRLRDMGIGEPTAVELALEHWFPLWESEGFGVEGLEHAFASSYAYAQGPVGADTKEGRERLVDDTFSAAPVSEPTPAEKPVETMPFVLASEVLDRTVPPTQWLVGHRIVRGFTNVLVAPGGIGKSTLALADALSVASGKPLLGDPVWATGKVWYNNFEDGTDEMLRRALAAARHYGLEEREVLDRLLITTGPDHGQTVLVKKANGSPVIVESAVQRMIRTIEQNGIAFVVGDPFVRSHRVDENDNMSIDLVAQAWDRIAKKTGCAVLLVHHTKKIGSDEDGRGNMDMMRGASALAGAVRSAFTLTRMSKDEGKAFGFDTEEGQHMDYLRLDNAKSNMAPPAKKARWFKLVGVDLNNADDVYRADCRATLVACPEISQRGTLVEQVLRLAGEYLLDAGGNLDLDGLVDGIFALAPEASGSDTDIRKLLLKELKTKRRVGPYLMWSKEANKKTQCFCVAEEK